MPASVPNVMPAPPTPSSASAVNANFTALKTYINTSLQTTDAAGTYTGVPELTTYIEPTNSVHFVPKQYVDKRGTTFIKASKGLGTTANQLVAINSSLGHNVPSGTTQHLLEFSGSINPISAGGSQGYAEIIFNSNLVYFHVFDIAPDLHTAFHGSILTPLALSSLTFISMTVVVGIYSGAGAINDYQLQDGSMVWTCFNDDVTVLT